MNSAVKGMLQKRTRVQLSELHMLKKGFVPSSLCCIRVAYYLSLKAEDRALLLHIYKKGDCVVVALKKFSFI